MIIRKLNPVAGAIFIGLLAGAQTVWGADAAPAASATSATPATSASAPAASAAPVAASASAAASAPAGFSGRGGRGTGRAGSGGTGRGGRGGAPMTDADRAEIAKLADLPLFKAGAGDGDFRIAPPYANAPEMTAKEGGAKGKIITFTMQAADSKIYAPTGLKGTAETRLVTVYVPSQYVAGTAAPYIVTHDAQGARNNQLPNILDNMIAEKRVPAMVAIMVANGGGDGPGSERGLEYDTVSGKFAEFIETEVLPRVEKEAGVTLSKDPDARATMGGSSGGAVAFSMAWFHPELYHRVITYSGTYVNQAPNPPDYAHGAWEYHENLIPKNSAKPIRLWMEVGQNDNGSTSAGSGFHNWVIANIHMAAVLKAKGYHYQFIYAEGAGHVDAKVVAQTMPEALEWVWQGYKPAPAK